MNTERIRRVREAMEVAGLDVLVCRLPENVLFLTGHWPLVGLSFLLFPLDGQPTIVVPHCDEREAAEELWTGNIVTYKFAVLGAAGVYCEVARRIESAAEGKNWRRVGYEGSFETVAPPWNAAEPAVPASATAQLLRNVFDGCELADATDLLHLLRARKTPWEAEKFRVVNEIAALGLEAFAERVDIGVTGIELVAAVESAVLTRGTGYKGARRVRAFAQISVGVEETCLSYRPMVITGHSAMAVGDLALLELGVVADGFWSDRTRMRVAGKPNARQADAYLAVRAAQDAAIAAERAGVTAGEVDQAARAVIHGAGLVDGLVHVTGHGVGWRYHEPAPLVCPGSDEVIEEGMIHSIEPGVYFPDLGGLRLEDDVLVKSDGVEVLGPFSRELT